MILIGLPKGRIYKEIRQLLENSGIHLKEDKRKLIFGSSEKNIQFSILRGWDIPKFVSYGAVDIGIVGKDVLLETEEENFFEVLDLEIGKCRLSLAAKEKKVSELAGSTIASKFPKETNNFLSENFIDAEIIELKGSIEIAPILGISDFIVDLVNTGNTLKENGLKELKVIKEISTRLIVNKSKFRTKNKEIKKFIQRIKRFNSLNDKDRNMLIYMADRIEKFHNNDIRLSEELEDDTVEKYGYFLRPIDKVGLYAPGGKAQYPSSVLMTGVLAKLAGVNEITVMFPGKIDDLNLMFAASHLIGAKSVLNSGGAHTLAAVAFGTESIGRVDKVFGPGNRYVSEAKRQLYGEVGIDSLNGPSEVAIIVDENSSIEYAAKDFLAQAEHGEDSRCFLIHLPGFDLNKFNESLKKNLSIYP